MKRKLNNHKTDKTYEIVVMSPTPCAEKHVNSTPPSVQHTEAQKRASLTQCPHYWGFELGWLEIIPICSSLPGCSSMVLDSAYMHTCLLSLGVGVVRFPQWRACEFGHIRLITIRNPQVLISAPLISCAFCSVGPESGWDGPRRGGQVGPRKSGSHLYPSPFLLL
ncbi:hypothetical protein JZ751_014679 [Albula glossodonta]|uniref:Uncharacterized protein n=1 Tax=Albula glossodonta TaxID=121402 RepID=A0A8T2N2C0_9TELE|nr:hypothetical protein JZ751_014679 [Albula glossodonta]